MAMSGFLFMKGSGLSPLSLRFLARKAQRLLVPYFSVSILLFSIKVFSILFAHLENPVELSTLLKIPFYPAVAYYLWFIYTLFLIFFLTFLFSRLPHGFIVFTVAAILFYFIPIAMPNIFCLNQLKEMTLFFVAGCWFSKIDSKRLAIASMKVLATGSFVFHLLIVFYFQPEYSSSFATIFRALAGLSAPFYLFVAIQACSGNFLLGKILAPFSHYGTSIYLWHTLSMGAMKALLAKATAIYALPGFFPYFSVILAGLFVPMLLARCVLYRFPKIRMLLEGSD